MISIQNSTAKSALSLVAKRFAVSGALSPVVASAPLPERQRRVVGQSKTATVCREMTSLFVTIDDFLKEQPLWRRWRRSPNNSPRFTDAEVSTKPPQFSIAHGGLDAGVSEGGHAQTHLPGCRPRLPPVAFIGPVHGSRDKLLRDSPDPCLARPRQPPTFTKITKAGTSVQFTRHRLPCRHGLVRLPHAY